MNKLLVGLVIAVVNMIVVSQAKGDITIDIKHCSSMKDETKRLSCYDLLTSSHSSTDSEQPSNTLDQSSTKTPTNIGDLSTTQKITPVQNSVIATKNRSSEKSTSSFGHTKSNESQSINSRLIGQFSSWKKGMKLRLENGQVWKVSNESSGYKKINNPLITISRGFWGSFNAKIEGLNSRAKVKRIK